jgi:hypothetical protein
MSAGMLDQDLDLVAVEPASEPPIVVAARAPRATVAVEPPAEPGIVVSLPGHYWLASKREDNGVPRAFSCRAINISTDAVVLAGPAQSFVGEPALAEIEHLGRLEGHVIGLLGKRALVMGITATAGERRKLAARIKWVERLKDNGATDARADARFVPRNCVSIVIMPDRSCLPCLITDLSTTGAAVAADVKPKLGAVLTLGKIIARVVRHLDGGFAVAFLQKQDRQKVEALATRR